MGAETTVVLGGDDDAAALQADAGNGYDVVLDLVYGKPFLAALQAAAVGATLITVGEGAGASVDVLRAAYDELTQHAAAGRIRVETRTYGLGQAAEAWQAQAEGPHVKIAVAP